jgi:hypothetical protein
VISDVLNCRDIQLHTPSNTSSVLLLRTHLNPGFLVCYQCVQISKFRQPFDCPFGQFDLNLLNVVSLRVRLSGVLALCAEIRPCILQLTKKKQEPWNQFHEITLCCMVSHGKSAASVFAKGNIRW